MENTKSVILTAVKCFLEGKNLPEGLIKASDDGFLLSLFKAADRHEIAPILSEMLYKSSALNLESDAAKRFKQSQLEAFYRLSKQQFEIERLSAVFNDKNMPFILLKGAVIRQFYPDAYLRTSCDIDVLVKNKDIEIAAQLLTNDLGYKMQGWGSHDIQFLSESGVHIELHYSLVEDDKMPKTAKVLNGVWENSKADCGSSFKMSNEQFLFYHVAHMAKHFLYGGCGIRTFVDLWLIRKNMPCDLEVLEEMLKSAELFQFYNSAVSLCQVWFNGKEPSDLDKKMEEYIITGGVYGNAKNNASVRKVKGKDRASIMLGVVFYPNDILKKENPILNNYPWLIPLYQVKRWFRIFNKDKRKKVASIYKSSGAATDDSVQSVAELLKKLNLENN